MIDWLQPCAISAEGFTSRDAVAPSRWVSTPTLKMKTMRTLDNNTDRLNVVTGVTISSWVVPYYSQVFLVLFGHQLLPSPFYCWTRQ